MRRSEFGRRKRWANGRHSMCILVENRTNILPQKIIRNWALLHCLTVDICDWPVYGGIVFVWVFMHWWTVKWRHIFIHFFTAQIASSTDSMSDATREASEVLHTLMPIERIEKKKCEANVSLETDEKPILAMIGSDERMDEAPEVTALQTGTENVFNSDFDFRPAKISIRMSHRIRLMWN